MSEELIMPPLSKKALTELYRQGKIDHGEYTKVMRSRKKKPTPKPDPVAQQTAAIQQLATATSQAAATQAETLSLHLAKLGDLVVSMGNNKNELVVEKGPKRWKVNVHRDSRKMIKAMDVEVVG